MNQHTRPNSRPCSGVFVWGKTDFRLHKAEIRRECPLCGFRQRVPKGKAVWEDVAPNQTPGEKTEQWVNGLLR